jgi:membrane-bound lytic murein transglycosylase F
MIKNGKKIVLALFLIFIIFWAGYSVILNHKSDFSVRNQIKGIKESGYIIICGEGDDFSYYSEKGKTKGFHYTLAVSFAGYIGTKLIYIEENNFKKRLKLLESGKCDIITGAIPVTLTNKKNIDFSTPIYKSRIILVQNLKNIKENPDYNQLNFFNKPLNVLKGSPYISRLHNLSYETGDSVNIREISLTGNEQLINFVSKGLIEYAACDEMIAKKYVGKFKNIDINTPLGFTQFIGWGVKKGNGELLEKVNTFMIEYKKSSGFTELLKEYL